MKLIDSINRFRLGVFWPDPSAPFSLGRCFGPLLEMAKEDHRLEIIHPEHTPEGKLNGNWHWLLRCDALYMQNPVWDCHAAIVATAKMMGLPVWSDWGDDPFTVRFRNPNFDAFSDKENMSGVIEWVVRNSDVNSVPTALTRASFPAQERVLIIPEACRWPAWSLPRQKIVSWRGMSGHDEDVESVLPELCEVAGEFADWKWILLGDPPKRMIQKMKEAAGEDPLDPKPTDRILVAPYWPTPFHMAMAWGQKAPYLHIVPLADNDFNRSKPPNAWMEATAMGAAVVAPDWPEWQVPGIVPYGGNSHLPAHSFADALRRELRSWNGGALHPNVASSRADIYPKKTLRAVNELRWKVVNKLAIEQEKSKNYEYSRTG